MLKKTSIAAALTAATTMLLIAGGCTAGSAGKSEMSGATDYAKMTPEALADHLIFETNSFKLDQPVPEGGEARARLVQDELQKTCSELRGKPIDPETAGKINAMARATLEYPEGGIKLGDWQRGRELAWSGFGYRVGHKNDDHDKRQPGGNCYNCHQLATDRTGGTIGPVLTNYGKLRGTSDAMLKYAYEVIYNPHTYFACTHMPRMGAKGLLTTEQISHIMAYLFDPESPVNTGTVPSAGGEGDEGSD